MHLHSIRQPEAEPSIPQDNREIRVNFFPFQAASTAPAIHPQTPDVDKILARKGTIRRCIAMPWPLIDITASQSARYLHLLPMKKQQPSLQKTSAFNGVWEGIRQLRDHLLFTTMRRNLQAQSPPSPKETSASGWHSNRPESYHHTRW